MAAAILGIMPGASLRRRADRSLRRRSKRASISSTPRTAIRSATAKRSSAARSRISRAATRSSSPPRCTAGCVPAPMAPGFRAKRSSPRSTTACVGSVWIMSTSIKSIVSTTTRRSRSCSMSLRPVKRAISAPPRCTLGSSPAPLGIAARNGWTRFVSMQNLVNLIYREEEREILPLCKAEGIGVIPWSPQARGKLSRDWDYTSIRTETDEAFGRLFAKTDEADRKVADRVAEVARARGIPRAQVALAWLLSKPIITAPIVGATKLHHLDDAIASVAVKLRAEEVVALEEPYVPHAVVGFV